MPHVFGQSTTKPATILQIPRAVFKSTLEQREDHGSCQRDHMLDIAAGRQLNGTCRMAKLKEYPVTLSRQLACAIGSTWASI
eukprot:9254349-Pyramimonas_sp.AAC.1